MNKLSRVGIDLAKNVFQLHGVDRHGKVVWRRRLTRNNWLKVLLEKIEPGCTIGMEACTGAHHWARELQAKGNGTYLAIRQVAMFANLLTSKVTRYLQPRVGFGPSLAGTRFEAPGPLPDCNLRDEFEQDIASILLPSEM